MDDDVVLNIGDVNVKLSVSGKRKNKPGTQKTKKGRYRYSPNWSQVCSDLLRLLGVELNLKLSCTFSGFLLLLESGLATILLILYGTIHESERYCAMFMGIAINSFSLLVFFIATTFSILDLGSSFLRADLKGLKFVVHLVILFLQVSTLIIEFTELVDSDNQDFTIFFTCLLCLIMIGNISISKREYDIARQQKIPANNNIRRKVKRRAERKRYYKRLHHPSIY